MELLDTLPIPGKPGKRLELYQGDLTDLTADESFDLLVLSAFPDDYMPTRTSLIGALHRKGLSVGELARNKRKDLRQIFSCWLSQEFSPPHPGIRFRQILCFEPQRNGRPPELIGDIFRALTPILAEQPQLSSIAMPLVAAGNQGYSVHEIMVPLRDAALHWMEHGLPLEVIKIVVFREDQARDALKYFRSTPTANTGTSREHQNESDSQPRRRFKKAPPVSLPKAPPPADEKRPPEYDVFISYARENAREMELLESELRQRRQDIRIFLDRKQIDIGSAWQPQIFESLDHCRRVVALFSPDYLNSRVCKEEFNIAWIRARETERDIIFPIYIYSTNLPTYMKYRNYVDCREGAVEEIRAASVRLLESLDGES